MAFKSDFLSRIIYRNFATSRGELTVGGVSVRTLVEKHGTPLYVYDRNVLDRTWRLISETFPAEFSVFYSVKANPNQAFLRYFLVKGCGLEVASGGELYQALRAGCSPQRIIFAGPGKTESELEMALAEGIGEIHVESLVEADRISTIGRKLRRSSVPISLRINPNESVQGGAMRMGGKPAPFGVDEEMLENTLDHLATNSVLDLHGIHLFTGTQILDHKVLINQYRRGLELAARAVARLQRPLRTLDFGGGLGIPYFSSERELDMDGLASKLQKLLRELRNHPMLTETQLIIEPGRFLVGEAGIYVTRVTDIKVSRGKKLLITDGGMHQHLAASGNLGQTIKRNYPIVLLTKIDSLVEEPVDIVGPLCTPLDVLGRAVHLPRSEVGDLVGVLQSGAYARSASPLGFLSHRAPPEVWVERGNDYLIRSRGEYKDYLRDQLDLSAQ